VVVGDQSSGKSSVLESLTGFPFPRAAGLCTRYATQITCKRDKDTGVSISIRPRPGANAELTEKLGEFSRYVDNVQQADLAKIFQDVSVLKP
jgi:GTPase SAR1 family protein